MGIPAKQEPLPGSALDKAMSNPRRTRIVCTLGPAVDNEEALKELLHAGMNIARLNFSHGNHQEHHRRIARLRKVAAIEGIAVAIMLDTRGPEIRTGEIEGDAEYELITGDQITVTTEEIAGTRERIGISYKQLPKEAVPGLHLYIADGLIDLEVLSIAKGELRCVVRSGGTLGSRKNVNIPGIRLELPAMTEKDREDIIFGIDETVDFVAASFIRTPEDVEMIQALLRDYGSPIRVIAKIEDQEGLSNIDEITRLCDGVMVARGDLGVQLPIEEIPLAQKRIIALCNERNKPVITATQLLDSMIRNARPTRAELTDVANAIFDGTDALMLSGETAIGKYPARSCATLDRIARSVERSPEYRKSVLKRPEIEDYTNVVAGAVAKAAFQLAEAIGAAAIIAPTLQGNTARLLSKYRPSQPVVAATTSELVQRQLLLCWGVIPLLVGEVEDSGKMVQNALEIAMEKGLIGPKDRVVTTAGIPLDSTLPLNTITVHHRADGLSE